MKRYLLLIILALFFVPPVQAQNKVYIAPETPIVFNAAGTDEVFNIVALAQDTGTSSSFLDLGANSRAVDYDFTLFIDGWASNPVVGDRVDLYFSTGTSTASFDGAPTTAPSDGAVGGVMTEDQARQNCIFAGSALAVSTTAADEMRITGIVRLTKRYVFAVLFNKASASDPISSSASHSLILTPIPPEIQ